MSGHGRKTRRRILVIDDNPSIHEDFRKVLTPAGTQSPALDAAEQALFGAAAAATPIQSFDVDTALQGREGLEKVREGVRQQDPYAMAFVDVRMPPGWDGIETVSRIWQEYPALEVVICTAYSDYDWAGMMGRLDRNDKLLVLKKPFDNIEVQQMAWALTEKWSLARQVEEMLQRSEQLVAARTRELQTANERLVQEVAERKRAEESLQHSAFHDALTDLPNRALFMDRLKQAASQKQRRPEFRFGVLFVDLDNFKNINDTLGHEAGDAALVAVAERFRKCLRPTDTLARLGGDEFTVLLHDIKQAADAEVVVDRLRQALAPPLTLCGTSVTIEMSVGSALCLDDQRSADDLLREADAAMYRAKAPGLQPSRVSPSPS